MFKPIIYLCISTLLWTLQSEGRPKRRLAESGNTNSPIFEKGEYRTRIRENNKVGDVVLKVTATDDDKGSAGVIQYSLSGDGARFFDIDPASGVIKANQPLDYETNPSIDFQVIAKDGGTPQRSGNTTVKVSVMDQNDNAPVFQKQRYLFDVPEEVKAGTVIGSVQATDDDKGSGGVIQYSLSGDGARFFDINPASGVIKANQPLDYETNPSTIDFQVIAKDGGTPQRSGTARVRVSVVDQNDNAPVFQKQRYVFDVPEEVKAGTVIGSVQASDEDAAPPYKEIRFTILKSKDAEKFSIDPHSGVITTTQNLDEDEDEDDDEDDDEDEESAYNFQVQAENPGSHMKRKVPVTVRHRDD